MNKGYVGWIGNGKARRNSIGSSYSHIQDNLLIIIIQLVVAICLNVGGDFWLGGQNTQIYVVKSDNVYEQTIKFLGKLMVEPST